MTSVLQFVGPGRHTLFALCLITLKRRRFDIKYADTDQGVIEFVGSENKTLVLGNPWGKERFTSYCEALAQHKIKTPTPDYWLKYEKEVVEDFLSAEFRHPDAPKFTVREPVWGEF